MQNPKLKIIVLAGTVILQGLLSFLLITFVFKNPSSAGKKENKKVEEKAESNETDSNDFNVGEIYLMEDIVVNPAGTMGRRFIAMSLGLELCNGQSPDEIKNREPKLQDIILSSLSQKGLSEFINTANREVIREEILETIKQTIPDGIVKQVYITRFIIQ